MNIAKVTRDGLLRLAKEKKVFLEGNFLKVIEAEKGDIEFQQYLDNCKAKDLSTRKKRLEVTKQVQQQNKELEQAAAANAKLMDELQVALEETKQSAREASKAKAEAEKLRDEAMEDLDTLQKRTQFELINLIVRVALWVILGVGVLTTILYIYALSAGVESTIIETTWSNLFGILLTNSFSIVGTIMGVKYASKDKD